MIPIRDENPTHSTPYVTIALIILNALIFLTEVTRSDAGMRLFVWKYGFVPAQLVAGPDAFLDNLAKDPPRKPVTDQRGRPLFLRATGQQLTQPDIEAAEAILAYPAWFKLLTCMFLHGGWMHLIGNMLFLWIFGNNIEDRLGHVLFIVFYLGTGAVGSLAHAFAQPDIVPLVGASGAISGVMGGYVLLFPRTRVTAIVPIGYYPATVSLPAWVFLAFYIVVQNIWPAARGAMVADQVAYLAHIGGFAAGMAMIFLFPHRKLPPTVSRYDPEEDDADFVL